LPWLFLVSSKDPEFATANQKAGTRFKFSIFIRADFIKQKTALSGLQTKEKSCLPPNF